MKQIHVPRIEMPSTDHLQQERDQLSLSRESRSTLTNIEIRKNSVTQNPLNAAPFDEDEEEEEADVNVVDEARRQYLLLVVHWSAAAVGVRVAGAEGFVPFAATFVNVLQLGTVVWWAMFDFARSSDLYIQHHEVEQKHQHYKNMSTMAWILTIVLHFAVPFVFLQWYNWCV